MLRGQCEELAGLGGDIDGLHEDAAANLMGREEGREIVHHEGTIQSRKFLRPLLWANVEIPQMMVGVDADRLSRHGRPPPAVPTAHPPESPEAVPDTGQ